MAADTTPMARSHPDRNVVWAIVGLLALAVGISFVSAAMSPASRSTIEYQAQPIIDAVHKYLADHGHCPSSLAELIPSYIREIPPPPRGSRHWGYHSFGNNRDEFSIEVENRREKAVYNSRYTPHWYFDDGSF